MGSLFCHVETQRKETFMAGLYVNGHARLCVCIEGGEGFV